MTKCHIIRTFPFATDGIGIKMETATYGETRDDIPEDLIEGLVHDGYIELVAGGGSSVPAVGGKKDAGGPPENKMEPAAAPENKDDADKEKDEGGADNKDADDEKVRMAALRVRYKEVVGKKPFSGWDEATLNEKIADAEKAKAEGGE